MPKTKRIDSSTKSEPKTKRIRIETDVKKTFSENVDLRFKHWAVIDKEKKEYNDEIATLQQALSMLDDNPENRIKIADINVQIKELRSKIEVLEKSNDKVEYLACVASIIKDMDRDTPTDESTVTLKRKIDVSNPNKPHKKKKKSQNQKKVNDENIFYTQPISVYFPGAFSEKGPSSKKLAQMLHEIPLDTSERDYCPVCPSEIMSFEEKPPSLYCKKCGLKIEVLDNTSAAVHDKETTTRNPFTYLPKLHFIKWIRAITGRLKYSIPRDVIDEYYMQLHKRGIKSVSEITWELVNDITKQLAKMDKRYALYYPHVYQITNILRGGSLLEFTEEQENELFDYFDPIYMLWEMKKIYSTPNVPILCIMHWYYRSSL